MADRGKRKGRIAIAVSVLALALVLVLPVSAAQAKAKARTTGPNVGKVTVVPPGSAEGHPVPATAPRSSVESAPLARRNAYGELTCRIEAAVGVRPLDADAILSTCELPFTIVPEMP